MVGELFPTALRASGLAMTAGLATALVGRHGTCGGSDPGLTLAPDLDQIDAGIPQRVNESPERGIV
jgi:hypothetical protein